MLTLLVLAERPGGTLLDNSSSCRRWSAADGLPASYDSGITVGSSGREWVRPGDVASMSMLDGYGVHTLPNMRTWQQAGTPARVLEGPAGPIWSSDRSGLRQFANGSWVLFRIPRVDNAALTEFGAPIIAIAHKRVVQLLPDRWIEYDAAARRSTTPQRAPQPGSGDFPQMDGLEATASVRDREKQTGGHIPIIALTAIAMRGDQERCPVAGMDRYLAKPIQAADLLRLVASFVRSKKSCPSIADSRSP
ncbi:MAG TPA: response regulator [Bryobacteraceae bacterium]|nr:response regulator [Bryobacteraceae bacterium]